MQQHQQPFGKQNGRSAAGQSTQRHSASNPFNDQRKEAVAQQQLNSLIQKKDKQDDSGNKGLPAQLKNGIEKSSGYSMDDVSVHFSSSLPAQFKAEAMTQGNQIHIAPGKEQHLAHEAWHVVQQKQDRVKAGSEESGRMLNTSHALEKEADEKGSAAAKFTIGTAQQQPIQLKEKQIAAPVVQLKRMTEIDLADDEESDRIVNDLEFFGARPDWGSEMDKLRGNDEQLRHEYAWDQIKSDIREELTGSSWGWGLDYSLQDVGDYLQNQGYDPGFVTKKNVERAIDNKLTDAYRDKTNVWSGEKKDNEARGRLLGTLKGYKEKSEIGYTQNLRFGMSSLSIVDQFGKTLPKEAYSVQEHIVSGTIFGDEDKQEKIHVVRGKGVLIGIKNQHDIWGAETDGPASAWVWREKKKNAFAVDPSFDPGTRAKLTGGEGITSKNGYYGDIQIDDFDKLETLYNASVYDANPLWTQWTPDSTILEMLRMKQIKKEVNQIIGDNDGNLSKKKKFQVKSYQKNMDGLYFKYNEFNKWYGPLDDVPEQFQKEMKYAKRLKDKIDRNS